MSEESNKLEKIIKGFLKGLAITSFSLAGINCVPAEEPWSEWPLAKTRKVDVKHYNKHSDDPMIDFSLFGERESDIYDYFKFNSSHTESSYKIGRQSVVRLKRSCGKEGHSEDCIPRSMHGITTYNSLDDQAVLVTLRKNTLHYILESDDTSFADLEYNPRGGEKEQLPVLTITTYRIKDGKAISSLNSRDQYGKRDIKISHWEDIIKLDGFLRGHFDGDSIFTKDDVFEAKYFDDPNKTMGGVVSTALSVMSKRRPLFERSSLLEDYTRRYKRVSDRAPMEHGTPRGEAKLKLQEAYTSLMKEINGKTWKTDLDLELNRDQQKDKILENLRAAGNYLGVQ